MIASESTEPVWCKVIATREQLESVGIDAYLIDKDVLFVKEYLHGLNYAQIKVPSRYGKIHPHPLADEIYDLPIAFLEFKNK